MVVVCVSSAALHPFSTSTTLLFSIERQETVRMSYAILNSVGLGLDIIGVLLIFNFGVAALLDTGGHSVIVTSEVTPEDKAEDNRTRFWSRVGLGCLVFGFLLQIASNFIGVDRAQATQVSTPTAQKQIISTYRYRQVLPSGN